MCRAIVFVATLARVKTSININGRIKVRYHNPTRQQGKNVDEELAQPSW